MGFFRKIFSFTDDDRSEQETKPPEVANTTTDDETSTLEEITGTQDANSRDEGGDRSKKNRKPSGETVSTVDNRLPAKQEKFAVNFVDTEYRQTRAENGRYMNMNFVQTGSDGNLYVGEDVRELFFEDHRDNPSDNIWLGYQSRGDNPMREVGMEEFSWFRHISMFGTTGMGKTTLQKNLINQVVRKGYGCVVIDPKGDMALELMQEIPEDRLDDVIWIEPGSTKHPDKVAGINFLEASVSEDDPRYDREVESIVDDLQAILKAEGYWGPKMAGITKNITRAMIRSRNPYTLYDMYNVLNKKEKRWNFLRSLEREGIELRNTQTGSILTDIKQYSERIAEMDEDEVDPVVRRLQDWVESPLLKEIVSHRNSSVSINDAVESGKIMLVRNTVQNEEAKRVVSTAIMRRVWATIQSRAEEEEEEDREPFFALIDEFDDVVSEDMNIKKMLTKARSGKMSVCLACQNPAQIEEDHEGILRQIFSNTDTMITFGIRGPDDSALVAKRMGEEIDKYDIMGMPEFRVLTRIAYQGAQGRQVTDALGLRTFPDYPPLRTKDEAHEAIERSLDRYGVEPMANSPEETDLLISGGGMQEQTVVDFLSLVWGEQLKYGVDSVTIESFSDRFERVLGHPIEDFPSGIGVPPEMIEVHNVNLEVDEENDNPFAMGEEWYYEEDKNCLIAYKTQKRVHIQKLGAEVSITADGINAILQQDNGRNRPTAMHIKAISEGFRWFSRLGLDLRIPSVNGSQSVSDWYADIPVYSQNIPEAVRMLEAYEEHYRDAARITKKFELNLEDETVTQHNPSRIIKHVIRAREDGRKAIIMVKDGRVDGHILEHYANRIEKILTDPPFYRKNKEWQTHADPSGTEDPELVDARILYNQTNSHPIGRYKDDACYPLLPLGSDTVWVDTGEQIRLYDSRTSDANYWGQIKYSEITKGSTNAFDMWCRYDPRKQEWDVFRCFEPGCGHEKIDQFNDKEDLEKEYKIVRSPLYVEGLVDRIPLENEWEIVILPSLDVSHAHLDESQPQQTDKKTYDVDLQFPPEEVPLVYADGKLTPLIDENSDLLTGPRKRGERFKTDTTTSPLIQAQALVMSQDEIQEIMDTFEQIQLETDIKQLIDGYRREYTRKERAQLDEIKGAFGEEHPGKIDFWMLVWDYWSRSYDTGIPERYLADATMTATGLTRSKAKEAVSIAKDFELLIEATLADTEDTKVDKDTTILRLVQPEERPDLFVSNLTELKSFADRDKWADIWELVSDSSAEIRQGFLQAILEKSTELQGDKQTRAIIAVGCLCGAISESGNMYMLTGERPREVWLRLWEQADVDLRSPLSKDEIHIALRIELLDSEISEEEYFETALKHNELYSPDNFDDNQYIVNDPANKDGPEIIEREGPDPFDNPELDNGEINADSTDTTPSSKADTSPESVEEKDSQESQDLESVPKETHSMAATNSSKQSLQADAKADPPHDMVGSGQSSTERESFEACDVDNNYEESEKDKVTRILTYIEPEDVEDDFDIERDAVRQFVSEFCKVGNEGEKHIKTSSERMDEIFVLWIKANKINEEKLGKLSPTKPKNIRKGEMNRILKEEYNVEKARGRIGGKVTAIYRPIEISKEI